MNTIIFLLLIIIVIINGSQWQIEPESLTRADSRQAIGYYNSTIFVIGGPNNPRSLIKYDTQTKNITINIQNHWDVTTDIACFGQAWVQKQHLLYIIPWRISNLTVYNMADNTFTIQEQIPQHVSASACMATYDMFIFVLGGLNKNGYLNTTQIFNISAHQWMNQTPTLTEKKGDMACICHFNTQKVYIFGGRNGASYSLSSIETLAVNDIDNINQETWTLYSNILNSGGVGARAVIWGNDIIIIGGDIGPSQSIQQNQIFDTTTNTISLSYTNIMTVGLEYTAVANVYVKNNTLYTFGGFNGTEFVTTIQSITLGQPPFPSTFPTQPPNPTQLTINTPNPTSPFIYKPSNVEPVININVTINHSNISTTDVINIVQESVDSYMNGLSVNINYTLTVDIIVSQNKENYIQVIVFQLYTSDLDREYIDVDKLDEDVTTSLNNYFGNGVINIVVTQVDKQALYEARKTFYKQIIAIIAGFFAVVFIIAIVDAKKIRRNDYFKPDSLIIATMQILDCISDIFFIILIRYHPEFVFIFSFSTPLCILFVSSVFFVVVPIIFTLYQLHYIINKYWSKNDALRNWLNGYTCFIYAISLITGSSFAAVRICSSATFGFTRFSMPLSINERDSFLYRRIYSVLLMENIPQLVLALWFIIATHSHIDEMVYISMVFSVISILMSFLILCTSKQLAKTQDHCHISLDVTGDMFDVKKINFCIQNTNGIKNSLSVLLGLRPSMMEILPPQIISCGLQITILLYISHEKYEQLKVKDTIDEQHKKGTFATVFNDSWNLSSLPDIDNVICEQIASKQRAKMYANMKTYEMVNVLKNKNETH